MSEAVSSAGSSPTVGPQTKMWLKSCPRCRGELYSGKDIHGRFIACLQCGYYLTDAEEVLMRRLSTRSAALEAPKKLLVLLGGKADAGQDEMAQRL